MRNKIQKSKFKSQNFLKEIVRIKKEEFSVKTQNIQRVKKLEYQKIRDSEGLKFRKLFLGKEEKVKLIAEIKFASPTTAYIGSPDELVTRALAYESAGADAISIITEKHFFKGDTSFISKVKQNVSSPILQKDFIIDPIQIYDAKDSATDALLLIARLVTSIELKKFVSLCLSIGIEPVVEINNEEDLEKAMATKTNIIAVNARNLETFAVDVLNACSLINLIPNHYIKLGFSGIHSANEVLQYKTAGANGVLIGTSLMEASNIKNFINDLTL